MNEQGVNSRSVTGLTFIPPQGVITLMFKDTCDSYSVKHTGVPMTTTHF